MFLVLFKLISQGLFPLVKILTNFWAFRKKVFPSGKSNDWVLYAVRDNSSWFWGFSKRNFPNGKNGKEAPTRFTGARCIIRKLN
jgi:hypothetical protein